MSESLPERKMVTVTIDGREVQAEEGQLLIRTAIENRIYIPHFCWHPRMKPVAMCRLCLVEVEGQRGLPPACTTRVTDGMVVRTSSDAVKGAQQSVLEFLLINHPLDCPVCDKGGECPLQDQTLAFGPGESRFVEEKRHYEKPIPISDLVLLDRERCILCARCTRFADEIAGEPLIAFVGRGNGTQVLTFHDEPFVSYFSGNTVEICPVGALTATPYRFAARPWDLEQTDSSCMQCAVGCRIQMQSSMGKLVRFLGVDSEAVNQGWLCDKGRFSFGYANSSQRITSPLVRRGARQEEVSWSEALDYCAERLGGIIEKWGPPSVAVLGGAKSSNESAYAFARLARGVIGTPNVDAGMADALDPTFLLSRGSGERALIEDIDSASAVVLIAPDLREELPVLYLRVRQAAVARGVPLIEIGAVATSLTPHADTVLRSREGETAYVVWELAQAVSRAAEPRLAGIEKSAFDQAVELLRYPRRKGTPVIVVGRTNLAAHSGGLETAATELARAVSGRILPVARRGNVFGALWAGMSPSSLPGGQSLDDAEALERCRRFWGPNPALGIGKDALAILESAAAGETKALVLVGCDPLGDFPGLDLARQALERAEFVAVVDALVSRLVERADVVFPAAAHGEYAGSSMNLEGRLMWNNQKVRPVGRSRPDWFVATGLAERMGDRSFPETTAEFFAEMAGCAGLDADVTLGSLALASAKGEGIVLSGSFPLYSGKGEVEEPPRQEQYTYRLVSSRRLYGNGVVNRACAHLAGLGKAPTARLAPREMDRLGLSDGEPVRLYKGDRSCVLPAERDDSLPEGAVGVTFNADLPEGSLGSSGEGEAVSGASISAMIDPSEKVTEVRLETATSVSAGADPISPEAERDVR